MSAENQFSPPSGSKLAAATKAVFGDDALSYHEQGYEIFLVAITVFEDLEASDAKPSKLALAQKIYKQLVDTVKSLDKPKLNNALNGFNRHFEAELKELLPLDNDSVSTAARPIVSSSKKKRTPAEKEEPKPKISARPKDSKASRRAARAYHHPLSNFRPR